VAEEGRRVAREMQGHLAAKVAVVVVEGPTRPKLAAEPALSRHLGSHHNQRCRAP
jgi:hypothetical protein